MPKLNCPRQTLWIYTGTSTVCPKGPFLVGEGLKI